MNNNIPMVDGELPATANIGDMVFDLAPSRMLVYDGSKWVTTRFAGDAEDIVPYGIEDSVKKLKEL